MADTSGAGAPLPISRSCLWLADLGAVEVGGKYGWIDRAGKPVIEPRFEGWDPFSEGFAAVSGRGAQGVVDGQENPLTIFTAAKLHTVGQKNVTLWDVGTSDSVDVDNADAVTRLTFSVDGKTLATASNDGNVRLYDLDARVELPCFAELDANPDYFPVANGVESRYMVFPGDVNFTVEDLDGGDPAAGLRGEFPEHDPLCGRCAP